MGSGAWSVNCGIPQWMLDCGYDPAYCGTTDIGGIQCGRTHVGCCGFALETVDCSGYCFGGGGCCAFGGNCTLPCFGDCQVGPTTGSPACTLSSNDCTFYDCYVKSGEGCCAAATCGGPDKGQLVYCSDTGVTTPAPCGAVSDACWLCKLMCDKACSPSTNGAGKAGPQGGGTGSGLSAGGGKPSGAQGQQQSQAQLAALTSQLAKLGQSVTAIAKGALTTTQAALGKVKSQAASATSNGADLTIIIVVVLLIVAGIFVAKESGE